LACSVLSQFRHLIKKPSMRNIRLFWQIFPACVGITIASMLLVAWLATTTGRLFISIASRGDPRAGPADRADHHHAQPGEDRPCRSLSARPAAGRDPDHGDRRQRAGAG
jgi:hypothetical protein